MSLMENIATLTGTLKFLVDMTGLNKFQSALKRTEAQMRALDKQASALQAKLNKSFGITGKGSNAAKAKAVAALSRSLDKELLLETRLSKLQRQQYQTALASQKLVATGQREQIWQQSASLKQQIQSATLQARQYKTQQEALRVDLGKAKLQASAETSQLRQARLAEILHKRQQRTIQLQQQAAMNQTKFQRAEVALVNARNAGIRATERHAESKRAAQVREARATERQQHAAQRFSMQQDRFQAWKMKQSEADSGFGGLGMMGVGMRLGAVGAGLMAVTAGVAALNERLVQRTKDASESQVYDNIFSQVGGKNPENGKRAQTAFAAMTEKYGMLNNAETASDFRTFMLSQQARGIAMSKALATYDTQLAAFRASGMTKPQQDRAIIQLQQVRSIGKADTEDVKTFTESAPLIRLAITEAWGERTKYKGKNLDGAFMESIPDGKVLAQDFEAGFARFVSQQQDALARQMVSIDAQQNRVTNDKYLQAQTLNTDPELVSVIGERIQAERDLVAASAPLNKLWMEMDVSFMKFQTGLLSVATGLLHLGSGLNSDGSKKTEQEQLQERMSTNDLPLDNKMVGGHDYSGVDAETQHQGGWIGNFYNRLFGVQDHSKGEANNLKVQEAQDPFAMQFLKLDLSKLGVDLDNDGQYRPFRPPVFNAEDAMPRSALQPTYPGQPPVEHPAPNVTNNNTTTVNPGPVTITIHVPEGLDEDAIGRIVDERARDVVQDAWTKSWREADAANGSEVY